jgi:hypothetical protein
MNKVNEEKIKSENFENSARCRFNEKGQGFVNEKSPKNRALID